MYNNVNLTNAWSFVKRTAACAAVVVMSLCANAQSAEFKSLTQIQGVKFLPLSGEIVRQAMVQNGENLNILTGDLGNITMNTDLGNSMEDIEIFLCQKKDEAGNAGDPDKLKDEAKKILNDKNWELAMAVNAEEADVKAYAGKGKLKKTLAMLIDQKDEDSCVLMLIKGKQDWKDILANSNTTVKSDGKYNVQIPSED